jgi:hypothetical protein
MAATKLSPRQKHADAKLKGLEETMLHEDFLNFF